MTKISCVDNNTGNDLRNIDDVSDLLCIVNKPIKKICAEHEGVLLFPPKIEDTDDDIGDSQIIKIHPTTKDEVCITTGNILGFIGVKNTRLIIKSRFDKGRNDFFLHYMLQKVCSYNLFDFEYETNDEEIFDFLIFMFPIYLNTALQQGLYREYKKYEHNDANVKGTIDVGRHISRNQPFMGNIAYSTREYSYDNNVTQLIRHTIEFIKTKKYGRDILSNSKDTIDNVSSIVFNTSTYNSGNRQQIINKNLRPKVHPYYTEYASLQLLCLQILRQEEVTYGELDDTVCGILFDGAWLWEEYINVVLCDKGFVHPQNKKSQKGLYLFRDYNEEDKKYHNSGLRYPDFYKDNFVLDAKYKKLGDYDKVSKVDRNDIHQVITYMHRLKAKKGGFVAPLAEKQIKIPKATIRESEETLAIYGIEISKESSSYSQFCDAMKEAELRFLMSIETDFL